MPPVPYYDDPAHGITIYHGDCHDLLPRLDLGSIALVQTDPPYGEVTHRGARTSKHEGALIDFAATTSATLRTLIEALAPQSRAWYVATMEWRHIADLERDPPEGWKFVRFGIWVKNGGAPQFSGDRPGTGWEGIGILHRDTPGRMVWNGGGKRGVWTHNIVQGAHPTQKPLALVKQLVADFSNPGDLVVDPFMGSGTTARACKDLGRRFVGFEVEERWCAHTVGRLQQAVLPLFGGGRDEEEDDATGFTEFGD